MNELISAAIGVVVGVILNDPLIALRDSVFHTVKRSFLKRKKVKEYSGFFTFGTKESKWLIVDGDGEDHYSPKGLFTHFEKGELHLPHELQARKNKITKEQEDLKKKGKQYHFNGENYRFEKYTINRFSTEELPELHLWFGPSDYYTFLATDMTLDEKEVREKYFPDEQWMQPTQYFANSFGVNLLIITKDERVVFTKRSGMVGTNKEMYHISVNEGLSRTFDRGVSTQAPDVYRAAVRGIVEELGVMNVEAKDITYLSLGVDTRYSQWGLLGKARIDKTAEELQKWRSSGVKDKWENEEFVTVPFDVNSVVKFVAEHDPWTPAGLTCIYHVLISEFGRARVDREIARYFH